MAAGARADKKRTYPELVHGWRCKFKFEWGGDMDEGADAPPVTEQQPLALPVYIRVPRGMLVQATADGAIARGGGQCLAPSQAASRVRL